MLALLAIISHVLDVHGRLPMETDVAERRYIILKWSKRKELFGGRRYEVRPMKALEDPEPDWWTVVAIDVPSAEAFDMCKRLEELDGVGSRKIFS